MIHSNLLLLTITLGNLWIWKIFKENFVIGVLLVILSFLLFRQIIARIHKGQLLVLIFIFITISLLTLRVGFDKNIFITSSREQLQQNIRHGFYAVELGQLFTNKVSLYFYKNLSISIRKLEQNLFSNLDLNLYFFAGHPRERETGEFEKYPWILFPLFIAGLFLAIQYYPKIGIYFIWAALIGMFVSPAYFLGPTLFFPLINVVITLGLIYFLRLVINVMRGYK